MTRYSTQDLWINRKERIRRQDDQFHADHRVRLGRRKDRQPKYFTMKKYKELLEKSSKSLHGFRDAAARLYQIRLMKKIHDVEGQIRNAKTTDEKIELLSHQNSLGSALTVIATNVGATGVISNIGLLMPMITEEDIETWWNEPKISRNIHAIWIQHSQTKSKNVRKSLICRSVLLLSDVLKINSRWSMFKKK